MKNRMMCRMMVAMGLVMQSAPMAWAQVDFTAAELADGVNAIADPALRDIAHDLLEECRLNPEGDLAHSLETEAQVLGEATQATAEVLQQTNVEATVQALQAQGVPQEVAANIEGVLRNATEVLSQGGTIVDIEQHMSEFRAALEEAQRFAGSEVDFRELLAGGGTPEDMPEMAREFWDNMLESDQPGRDVVGRVLEAHFEHELSEHMMAGSPSPELMREMVEQMSAAGLDPREMFREAYEAHQEFASQEMMTPEGVMQELDRMAASGMEVTPEMRADAEKFSAAYQSGDWDALEALRQEYGMGPGPFADQEFHGGPGSWEAMGQEFGQGPHEGFAGNFEAYAMEMEQYGTGPMEFENFGPMTPEMAQMTQEYEHSYQSPESNYAPPETPEYMPPPGSPGSEPPPQPEGPHTLVQDNPPGMHDGWDGGDADTLPDHAHPEGTAAH